MCYNFALVDHENIYIYISPQMEKKKKTYITPHLLTVISALSSMQHRPILT